MTTLLSALAVAFAAFSVWLGVRIVNRRERWAKWSLTGIVAVPVLYMASFGPVCWLVSLNDRDNMAFILRPYWALGWLTREGCPGEKLFATLIWYGSVGMPDGKMVVWDIDLDRFVPVYVRDL
jgi:hypothetical protein